MNEEPELAPIGASETPEEAAEVDRMVGRLSFVVFLEWLGAGAVLPLLPLYLKNQGASSGMVGLTMSAFFLAGLATQFPAGRLTDRIGRRPVLIGGLLTYAIASAALILPINAWGFFALRFVQGGAAGAVEVASLALVAANIPIERRGRAVSRIFSAQLGGTAIGPIFGSLVGVAHMGILFLTTAVICSLAAVPVLTSRTIKAHDVAHHEPGSTMEKVPMSRALTGALLAAVSLGLGIGVYEACWSLLMHSRGATTFQIGLSWTAFSVPYVVLVRVGGWLADHADRRLMAGGGIVMSCAFCAAYPFVHSVPALLVMGFMESAGFASALPSIQALMTEGRKASELGRIQGLYATCQTAAIAVAAASAGALFGVADYIPFIGAAAIGFALVAAALITWLPVPGKVSQPQPATS